MNRLLLTLALLTVPAFGAVTITQNAPNYGWVTILGQSITISAFISVGTTNLVNWKTSGGELSCTATSNCSNPRLNGL